MNVNLFNFGSLFKCINGQHGESDRDKSNDNYQVLLDTIRNEPDKNVVVTEILLKLVINGGYSNALLYDQNNVLQRAIGNYERSSITYSYCTSIPIFVKGNLTYQLILLSKSKVQIDKSRRRLLDLLSQVLQ